MIIIIGLGNPGTKFDNTPHNAGFAVLDVFAQKNGFSDFAMQKKSESLVSEGDMQGNKIFLLKPQTFMNESGRAVQAFLKNIKNSVSGMVLVHDDIDLPAGKIKIVKERGSAGHKGVESVINSVGNEGLVRLRIGIGKEPGEEKEKAGDIVLKRTDDDQEEKMSQAVAMAAEALKTFVENGLEKAMNEYNK